MGWQVDLKELKKEDEEEHDASGSDSEGEGGGSAVGSGGEDEEEEDAAESDTDVVKTAKKRKGPAPKSTSRKRQRTGKTSGSKTATKGAKVRPSKKKIPHPKSSTSHLPGTILPEDLPADPFERALRLLHVGATPDSLPCREEEFVDVLSRVEEGVEGGGGGCLCESPRRDGGVVGGAG